MAPLVDDCWNQIGVQGDGSCVKLARCGHCRNCPAYSAAASDLLNREILEADLDDSLSAADAGQTARSAMHSAIVFRLGPQWLALATGAFDEIAEHRSIRSLPHRRGGALLGLVNIGGELTPCVSLSAVMALDVHAWEDGPEGASRRRLIVLRHKEGRLAFPVDEVQTLHSYPAEEQRNVPTSLGRVASSFTSDVLRWSEKMVARLDGERLVEALNRGVS